MKLAQVKTLKTVVSVTNGVMKRFHRMRVVSFGAFFLKSGEVVNFQPDDVGIEVILVTNINKPLDQKLVFPRWG